MTTIHDVARAAQVSAATISRVLAHPELVAETTRLRVQNIITELGYIPNSTAASLRTMRTGKIIVSVPNLANPFFAGVIRGIEEAAQKGGYSVLLGDTRNDVDQEERYATMLDRREADGLIFLGHRLPDALARIVERDGMAAPVVNGCEFSPSLGVSSVHIDNRLAAKTAMEALYDTGHRDIAIITGSANSPLSRDRLLGVKQAADDRGGKARLIVRAGDYSIESGRRAAMPLLKNKSPTAFFCFSDEMAVGVLAAIRNMGLRCPDDISVMGFDDIEIARYLDPALTTVRQPMRTIGLRTAELLIDIMNHKQDRLRSITLPHKLVVRQSVGPVRAT